MEVRASPAASGRDTFRQHPQDLIELAAFEPAVRIGPPHQGPQRVVADLHARRRGHHLLGEHVQRLFRQDHAVELAGAHRAHGGRALDQLVPRDREQDALWGAAQPVTRTPHPLQQRGEGTRRAYVADQVNLADVDTELQ